MKKILLALMAVVLMVVCASCAKNNTVNEAKKEMYTVNVYNRTGGNVTKVVLKDNKTGESFETAKIQDGAKVGMSINTTAEAKTGMPDLALSYTDAKGNSFEQTLIMNGKTMDVTFQESGIVTGAPKD